MPTALEDVAGWAEAIRQERLNETGRRSVDLLELVVRAMVTAREPEDVARLAEKADKLLRCGMQADKKTDEETRAWLKKEYEQRQRVGSGLELH